jgi:hypothetical protein
LLFVVCCLLFVVCCLLWGGRNGDAGLINIHFIIELSGASGGKKRKGHGRTGNAKKSKRLKGRKGRRGKGWDVERLRKLFGRGGSEEDSSESDSSSDDDAGERSSKLLTKASKLIRKNRFAHLGMFWKSTDKGYGARMEKQKIELDGSRKIRAKSIYAGPRTWFDFSILWHRLAVVYAVHHPSKVGQVLGYWERLVTKVNLGMCSVGAVIEYDHRIRECLSGSWKWLEFDQEIFQTAKSLHPIESSGNFQGGNRDGVFARPAPVNRSGGGGKRATPKGPSSSHFSSPLKGGGAPMRDYNDEPLTNAQRTSNGVCNSWMDKKPCRFSGFKCGCRFAHWCTNFKCVAAKDCSHRPSDCPN